MSYGVALRNGVPFTLGTIAALCVNATSQWTPLALWPNGISSAGMWISPSTLPASFNDYTGTTPVATPGTVADSANPVGLALDLRLGAPTTLGPELCVGPPVDLGSWTNNGDGTFAPSVSSSYINWYAGGVAGKTYLVTITITDYVSGWVANHQDVAWVPFANANGTFTALLTPGFGAAFYGGGSFNAAFSVREIPGNHMLQASTTARPLESARVNLLQYTEDFTNGYWVNATATVTPNYGTAPDGTQTSTRLQFAGANLAILKANILSTPTQAAASCYVKGVVGETLFLENNLSTTNLITLTGAWQRAVKSDAIGTSFVVGTYAGATARDVEVWHPQLEFGTAATPYQPILTDGSTYDATGITPWQLYDGTDDGMATASFAAGTLTSGMDCMIAVRRDSGTLAVAGLNNQVTNEFFGIYYSGATSDPTYNLCGTPTVWVDGVQLAGGTSTTRTTLYNALTAGEWHILEYRDLDLSAWTKADWGNFGASFFLNGARGDIMLYPSTASTTDKDAARQYLADKYGVTLP